MKVIIIGAGLSGLSTAIALRKYVKPRDNDQLVVKVYEKSQQRAESSDERRARLGAGISLQGNGLRILGDFDPVLKNRVHSAGYPCSHFKWKTAGNFLLGREYLDVLPISRPVLIDCLLEVLPNDVLDYRTVSNVITRQGLKPIVQFEDGTEESADLVVGADGIRSIVRRGLFGDNRDCHPEYLGISAVGGVLDIPIPQHLIDDPCLQFFMGSTGAFGYCGLTQTDRNKLLYWSIYETDLPEKGTQFDRNAAMQQLRDRHASWSDPIISKCLENASVDHVYPIFVMPKIPLWGRDGCVLVGDAAHAMSPRSGQGGSQAFEDAQTLGLLLAGHLAKHDIADSVSRTISGIYDIRRERVHRIRDKAMEWKDPKMPMSWLMTCVLYAYIFINTKVQYAITSVFGRAEDLWDAKAVVKKYLEYDS
ncbi:hypothetical protein BKA67DRAFT_581696 [Truncatella angustata]|uniref:FAD-binding domain-containing protein n=1 Tax=Truncatella angustata TaxID=152316 RepID=A0A9P8RMV1_9PEZI|nr:uncharacterized protein BKA67DRAFT_581696 [Truncatella angustata]KAH6647113.1 hypothetical protein BKA67DRAFT_581696 [Truncatella angustata]